MPARPWISDAPSLSDAWWCEVHIRTSVHPSSRDMWSRCLIAAWFLLSLTGTCELGRISSRSPPFILERSLSCSSHRPGVQSTLPGLVERPARRALVPQRAVPLWGCRRDCPQYLHSSSAERARLSRRALRLPSPMISLRSFVLFIQVRGHKISLSSRCPSRFFRLSCQRRLRAQGPQSDPFVALAPSLAWSAPSRYLGSPPSPLG